MSEQDRESFLTGKDGMTDRRMFEIRCPRCGTKIKVRVTEVKTQHRCRICTHEFQIPMTSIRPGLVQGSYWVQHFLGAGSISDLFLCKKNADNSQVVLKVLTPAVDLYPQNLERYLIHFCRSHQMAIPNIITPFETGRIMDHPYLAFPYVDAKPLDKVVREDGLFTEKQALMVILRVARLLRYAWQNHHMVHGDLKPSNILINDAGEVFLTDFGNFHHLLLPENAPLDSIDFDGKLKIFMAPERIKSPFCEPNPAMDIYSLGMILFFMLTGKVLQHDADTTRVMRRYCREYRPDKTSRGPTFTKDFAILLRNMLASSPSQRINSWQEVVKNIKKILKHRSHGEYTAEILRSPKIESQRSSTNTPLASSSSDPLRTFLILAGIILAVGFILAMIILAMNHH